MTWYNPVDDFNSAKHATENVLHSADNATGGMVSAGAKLFNDAYETACLLGSNLAPALPTIGNDLVHLHFKDAKNDTLKHTPPAVVEAVKSSYPWRDGGQLFTKDIPKLAHDLTRGDFAGAGRDVIRDGRVLAEDFKADFDGKMPVDCWTQGQVMEATLSSKGESSKEWADDLDGLNTLWDGSSNPPAYGATSKGDSKYYDDNAWVGIALMDAHKQNPNNPFYVQRAEQIFNVMKQGADTDKMSDPGGVFWEQGDTSRNAVSTGAAMQLALLLAQQTQDKTQRDQYVAFADKQFKWMDKTLKDRSGLYCDNIKADGTKDPTKYSYNQGLMIGDATMLYQATGDADYLKEAQDIATKSLAEFGTDGQGPFSKQAPMFGAVYFKNLMLLDSAAPDSSYRTALQQYAKTLKTHLADPNNKEDWPYLNPNPTNAYAGAEQVYSLASQHPV